MGDGEVEWTNKIRREFLLVGTESKQVRDQTLTTLGLHLRMTWAPRNLVLDVVEV